MSHTIRHVTISGRVQGVGFRAWVEQQASSLKLEGWVRNRRDGSVEAVFAGSREIVDRMIALCERGPSSSHVDVLQQEESDTNMLGLRRTGSGFSVLPTL